jgi:flagellar biosynthesis protein FliQ
MLKKLRESIERITITVTIVMMLFALIASLIVAIFSENMNALNEITFAIGAPIMLFDLFIVFPITAIIYLIEEFLETKNKKHGA